MRTIIDERAIIRYEQKLKCKERQTKNSFTSSVCIYVTLIFYVRGWSLHHPNQNICWILRNWILFPKILKRNKFQGQTRWLRCWRITSLFWLKCFSQYVRPALSKQGWQCSVTNRYVESGCVHKGVRVITLKFFFSGVHNSHGQKHFSFKQNKD